MGITTHPLNLTCMQGLRQCKSRQALRPSELPGGHKTARKVKKHLKAGDRREERKLGKSEVKQGQRQE